MSSGVARVCSQCNDELHDGEQYCSSCGGDEVERACNTCGVILGPDDVTCPSCSPPSNATPNEVEAETETDAITSTTSLDPIEAAVREELADEFRITGTLSRTDRATIFLADDLARGRVVTIKVLSSTRIADADASRFLADARRVMSVKHPHLRHVYAVRQLDDLFLLVEQYVPGCTLAEALRDKQPLAIDTTRAIAHDIGTALAFAHEHHITHGAVRSDNILLGDDGGARLTNAAFSIDDPAHRAADAVPYLSPEQCDGLDVTHATDQYALGVVLYEMLTGHVPFEARSVSDSLHFIHREPLSIAFSRDDCPEALERAVMRLLAKQPENRFPSVSDALQALGAESAGHEESTIESITQLARTPVRSMSVPSMLALPLDASSAKDEAANDEVANEKAANDETTDDADIFPSVGATWPALELRTASDDAPPVALAASSVDSAVELTSDAPAESVVDEPSVEAHEPPSPSAPIDLSFVTTHHGAQDIGDIEVVEIERPPVSSYAPPPIPTPSVGAPYVAPYVAPYAAPSVAPQSVPQSAPQSTARSAPTAAADEPIAPTHEPPHAKPVVARRAKSSSGVGKLLAVVTLAIAAAGGAYSQGYLTLPTSKAADGEPFVASSIFSSSALDAVRSAHYTVANAALREEFTQSPNDRKLLVVDGRFSLAPGVLGYGPARWHATTGDMAVHVDLWIEAGIEKQQGGVILRAANNTLYFVHAQWPANPGIAVTRRSTTGDEIVVPLTAASALHAGKNALDLVIAGGKLTVVANRTVAIDGATLATPLDGHVGVFGGAATGIEFDNLVIANLAHR